MFNNKPLMRENEGSRLGEDFVITQNKFPSYSIKSLPFGPSLELPHWGNSNEGPQGNFYCKTERLSQHYQTEIIFSLLENLILLETLETDLFRN